MTMPPSERMQPMIYWRGLAPTDVVSPDHRHPALPLFNDERESVLIIDDSTDDRSRSTMVELLSRVKDHITDRFIRGFRMLTLCWSDVSAASLWILPCCHRPIPPNDFVKKPRSWINAVVPTSDAKRPQRRARLSLRIWSNGYVLRVSTLALSLWTVGSVCRQPL